MKSQQLVPSANHHYSVHQTQLPTSPTSGSRLTSQKHDKSVKLLKFFFLIQHNHKNTLTNRTQVYKKRNMKHTVCRLKKVLWLQTQTRPERPGSALRDQRWSECDCRSALWSLNQSWCVFRSERSESFTPSQLLTRRPHGTKQPDDSTVSLSLQVLEAATS